METVTTMPHYYENELSAENLDKFLEDCMFIQFFNSFLSLQVFEYRLLYNAVTNQFEEFSKNVADEKDVALLSRAPSPKTNEHQTEVWTRKGYYITTVDREEGIRWIKEYRLPFFLRSEVYADFKLAKILASYQTNLFHKFLRPDLNFLHKLVNKSSSTTNNNYHGNSNPVSNPNNTSHHDISDDDDETTTNDININKINTFRIGDGVHEQMNMFNFLNNYISSTPMLCERMLQDATAAAATDTKTDNKTLECAKGNINDLLQQLYRNVKLRQVAETKQEQSVTFVNDYHQKLNDILLVVDTIKRDANWSDDSNMQFQKLLKIAELWPINLSYKQGIDAFKEFLDDTPGGRNVLLWTEVEMSRYCNEQEKKSILQEVKEKFFRADSLHYISKPTLKSWGLETSLKLTLEKLLSSRQHLLNPLVNYWCPRFTLHLYREKLHCENDNSRGCGGGGGRERYLNNDRRYRNLPPRPLSCTTHRKEENMVNGNKTSSGQSRPSTSRTPQGLCRTLSSEFFARRSSPDKSNDVNKSVHHCERSSSETFDDVNKYILGRKECSSLEMFDGTSKRINGITNKTRRAKSAHPRVLTTPDTRNTNAGYEQLLVRMC